MLVAVSSTTVQLSASQGVLGEPMPHARLAEVPHVTVLFPATPVQLVSMT
jgi:hypothetical protein